MKRFVYLCLLWLNTAFGVWAQDSLKTKTLADITVQSNRLTHFTSGNKIQKIDRLTLQSSQANNLADLLSVHSQVFIKSYGLGSLATPALRGTGASHTAVLWNGFNLQNSMNGNVDFALLPVFLLESVEIQYGGAGALFGSGAVGGAIHLNNSAEFAKGFSLQAQVGTGSFGSFQQGIKLKISKKNFVTGLKLFNQTAENDFPFVNTAKFGKPTEKQANSAFKQYGFVQDNYLKINAHQRIDFQIWYLNADRQIPPTLTTIASQSSQQDESLRLSSNWSYKRSKMSYFVRSAFFKEKLIYQEPDIQLFAVSKASTWIGEVESKIQLSPHQLLNVGVNHTYFQAETDGYRAGKLQHRTALFFSYKINNPKDTWNAVISLRKELIDSYFAPFTPSLGLEGILGKNWIFKGNFSKTYRVPTFNDLYWQGGGNPNLRPESGWSGEISMEYAPSSKRVSYERNIQFTIFNSLIDSWIAWLPNAQGRWSASNVLKVWSRGLEIVGKYQLDFQEIKINTRFSYNYVISTNEKVGEGNENSLYQQIIYVPKHTAQGNISLVYNSLQVIYNQTFTSERFTTADNSQRLPFFSLGNLSIHQKIKQFSLQIQVNNLWNVSYQQIAFRPMPMRSFQAVITYHFVRK
jgi:iron complex outermembrane receptor protein